MGNPHQIKTLFLYPTLAFCSLVLVIELSSFDLLLADVMFKIQGGSWAYRESWLLEQLLHRGGRSLSVAFGLLVLLSIIASLFVKDLKKYRRSLSYLFVSAATASIVVSLLKSATHVDCAWDLVRYGGLRDYIGLFEPRPSGRDYGQCFPAGHASAAYCWFGLFFLARQYYPGKQIHTLVVVVFFGVIFGVAQQLRGAHFVSHDLWTVWICWCSAYLWQSVLLKNKHDGFNRTN
jgi:membrane-associated PAP2 superfamily phosphatase